MGVSEWLSNVWYLLAGRGTKTVPLEKFAPVFAKVLEQIVPHLQIIRASGIESTGEWSESLEVKVIEAHEIHLLNRWQPAHNALNSLKPPNPFLKLHLSAMLASRAYGETVVTYIEYRRMFLSEEYLSDRYFRKQQEGRDWDSLTSKHSRGVIGEIESIAGRDSSAYKLLVPTETVLDGINSIAAEKSELLPFLDYAVVPFN